MPTIIRDGVAVEIDESELPAPVQQPVPLSLQQIAAGQLQINGWNVTGLERAQGVLSGSVIEEDGEQLLWIDFNVPVQGPYIVVPSDGVLKFPEGIAIPLGGQTDIRFLAQQVQ